MTMTQNGVPAFTAGLSDEQYRTIMEMSFERTRGTMVERCGIEFTGLGHEWMSARMPVDGNRQPAGLFHGGAHVVIAETLASTHAYLHAGGSDVVGVDLNATHVRSAREGWVHARAEAIHLGRRIMSHEVRMTDADDRLLSIVRITNYVVGRRSRSES